MAADFNTRKGFTPKRAFTQSLMLLQCLLADMGQRLSEHLFFTPAEHPFRSRIP